MAELVGFTPVRKLKRAVRTAIFPWRAAWAAANRFGLLGNPQVGASPHLDPAALARWRELAHSSKVYLEYGSGGSTVEAAQYANHVVSVETDGRFLAAVTTKIVESGSSSASFHPVHADIGWTEKWGRPLFAIQSSDRLRRWRDHTSAPWRVLNELGLVPDFIFVDGRFRAASVLDSFLRLPAESDTTFMLDDFRQRRDSYGDVLRFAADTKAAGRAVIFRRDPDFDRVECRRLLARYHRDPE